MKTITAHKGLFGNYWMAELNGDLICTHMHRTPSAAIKCGKRHLKFWNSVGMKPMRLATVLTSHCR